MRNATGMYGMPRYAKSCWHALNTFAVIKSFHFVDARARNILSMPWIACGRWLTGFSDWCRAGGLHGHRFPPLLQVRRQPGAGQTDGAPRRPLLRVVQGGPHHARDGAGLAQAPRAVPRAHHTEACYDPLNRYNTMEPFTIFAKANLEKRRLNLHEMIKEIKDHHWAFYSFGNPKVCPPLLSSQLAPALEGDLLKFQCPPERAVGF
eukprot:scaffold55335_cov46-Prasinocladus_malaysianus.AAC.2